MRGATMRLLLLGLLVVAAPAHGGEPGDADDGDLFASTKRYFGIDKIDRDCGVEADATDVIICARKKPPPLFDRTIEVPRVDAMKVVAFGAPPVGKGAGVGVTARGCFLQKCPKELYFIDVAALPEPAPGTDADKIARGEAPAP